MDDDFGFPEFNASLTPAPSIQNLTHTYSAEEVAVILGALSACVAGIVYSWRNVKSSSCCGGLIKCSQRTEIPPSKESILLETSNVSNV